MHVDDMNDLVLMGLAKEEAFAKLQKAEAEIERLRAALSALTWHPAVQHELQGTAMLARAMQLTTE